MNIEVKHNGIKLFYIDNHMITNRIHITAQIGASGVIAKGTTTGQFSALSLSIDIYIYSI
jgi:hypothetical protein